MRFEFKSEFNSKAKSSHFQFSLKSTSLPLPSGFSPRPASSLLLGLRGLILLSSPGRSPRPRALFPFWARCLAVLAARTLPVTCARVQKRSSSRHAALPVLSSLFSLRARRDPLPRWLLVRAAPAPDLRACRHAAQAEGKAPLSTALSLFLLLGTLGRRLASCAMDTERAALGFRRRPWLTARSSPPSAARSSHVIAVLSRR